MKHAMLALLVCSLMVTGGLERSFFLADDTPICLVVVADDASFEDLLTAAQIAREIVDLAGSGCPFSLIRFEEEISKEDTAKYNLIVLGESNLNFSGKAEEISDGLLLYENPFGTKRHVLVVEDAQSLLDLLQDL
ncbi:MAG: hypothetical protein HXS41_12710 [Theionarchaea archaeon]|nr:hypothetical protein [Theionarchaea archaeon]MBU7000869.1 hypothetical protein [Theionarchaea archaeon]MBU7021914.1 hypothetical protein [Theionarchaea archaeon]MBU7035929.1 hypothetical protein [Theionarchaea archaeon]MBU7040363.1 hypothetical protein [Theionarchaea archaeon]